MELEFDLDVAAPLQGIPWLPAKRWFCQADDGLAQDWGQQLVWMNPPFSHATPWVQKFIENANGIALVPVSRSKWFGDIWQRADGILTTPPDFKFERPDGKNQTISFQTFLFAIGEQSVAALERTKLGRVR